MRSLILLLSLLGCCLAGNTQSLARLDIAKDTTIFDAQRIRFTGPRDIVDEDFWGAALAFDGRSNNFEIDSLPANGFVLSFWFSPAELEQKQSLIVHQSDDAANRVLFELRIDSSRLIMEEYQGLAKPSTARSATKLEDKNWYYVIYTCQADQSSLRVRSTNFRLDATFPIAPLPQSLLTIGNSQQVTPLQALLNKIQLNTYSSPRLNSIRRQFDERESELYNYHRKLKLQQAERHRKLVVKDTVKINRISFFVDIWDYDEKDGDVLSVWADKGSAIYPGKEGSQQVTKKMDLDIKSKKEPHTFRMHLPADDLGYLYFSAKDMGFIKDLNTATIRIYTRDEALWDTIHINPDLYNDIQIAFQFDPLAQAPTDLNKPLDIEYALLDSMRSRSQEIFLRVSDFSIADGDVLGIQVGNQKPKVQVLTRQSKDIPFVLYQKEDTIKVWASATKFLSCTAKIEVYAKEGKGGSKRKLTELRSKIKKDEVLSIPISFGPSQRKVHRIQLRDSSLQISISDPQAIDGDRVQVEIEGKVLGSYELDEREILLPKISLHEKKKQTLDFICISKGELKNVANLCKVVIKNSEGLVLAEYILQMPDLNDPSKIHLEYKG